MKGRLDLKVSYQSPMLRRAILNSTSQATLKLLHAISPERKVRFACLFFPLLGHLHSSEAVPRYMLKLEKGVYQPPPLPPHPEASP